MIFMYFIPFKTFSMKWDKLSNIWFSEHDSDGAVEKCFKCIKSKRSL
jgi:hypothetical protein